MKQTLSDLLDRLYSFHHQEIDLNLERILSLLDRLGNPHKRLPPTLHIAGTNGKGSTIAFCRSILETAGYSVHTYTSPHLIRFNERIRLNGELINDELLYQALENIIKVNGSSPITFFEATTAAAFVLFSKISADVLLLETGMGGRLDATNVIESPLVSVITPISLDHQEFLGSSLSDIAFEKSGIIKQSRPVVISKQRQEVKEVLKRESFIKKSPCYVYEEDWGLDILAPYPPPSLRGEHQLVNAATALKALSLCLPLKPKVISQGLQMTTWPARMQCLASGPHEIWLDGAHNPGGAEALEKEIKTWDLNKPTLGIIAIKEKKDAKTFIKILGPCFKEMFFIPLRKKKMEEKFYDPDILLMVAHKESLEASKAENIQDALTKIQKKYPKSKTIITGSLFLAEEALGLST